MAQLKPIRRQGIVTEITDRIRSAIIKGTLAPGSTIDQNALASDLGVSRVPVREALMLLEQERLVLLNPRRSPRVAPIDAKYLGDAFDFWMNLDGYVAALLASRANEDWGTIDRLIKNGQQTAHPDRVRLNATQAFHIALYEATGNSVLTEVIKPLWNHIARVSEILMAESPITAEREFRTKHGGQENALWLEHQQILDAIQQGRGVRAKALAQAHVRRARDGVMKVLHQDERRGQE